MNKKMNESEPVYTNREIREFFREVKDQLDRIEDQTTKTNGRVTELEKNREYMSGASKIIFVIIVPILGFLGYEVINLMIKLN